MKIVTWNCNGALRNKLDCLNELDADLYVIQECENPNKSTKLFQKWAGSFLWVGENPNRGIGVFAKNDLIIQKLNWRRKYTLPGAPKGSESATWRTEDLKEFLPFRVNDQFNALAVWTKQSPGGTFSYAGQLWKYLQSHGKNIKADDCILLGDLNSHVRFDRQGRWWNHSDNVRILNALGLKSVYHEQFGLAQGAEEDPTFYMYRHKDRPYHMDYIFASNVLCQRSTMTCHDPDDWLRYSDHIPLEVTISFT